MKETEDMQTKNSLYTLLIFIGIPLMLVSVLAPPVFLIGDKNMDLVYELIWGGLCLIFVIYFIVKQMSGNKTDSNKNGESLNNV